MTPADIELASDGAPEEWWFNIKSGEVEFGRLSASAKRLGPFRTKLEAQNALKTLAERAAKIRKEDESD
jgi:hypothetical protein